jgi:hypothetical protein
MKVARPVLNGRCPLATKASTLTNFLDEATETRRSTQ